MEDTKAIDESNQCAQRKESENGTILNDSMGEGTAPRIANNATAASIDDNGPQTPMFMLIVDCFDHLFEWLTLSQLLVFRLTCKRMNLVVNQYIKRDYPKLQALKIFEQKRWLEFCQMPLVRFKWVKELNIIRIHLNNSEEINGIKHVLNQLEKLKLNDVQIDGDLYEVILKHCNQLKGLFLCDGSNDTVFGPSNDWLLRQYPTLERFQICKHGATTTPLCPELLNFFYQNPNIHSFGIDAAFLAKHRHLFLESKLNFGELEIRTGIDLDVNTVYNLINDLHKRDFFKVLMVADFHWPFSCVLQYPSFAFNLEYLCLAAPPPENLSVPVVESVTWLYMWSANKIHRDISKQMATNFVNLQYLEIDGNLNAIAAFVRFAPKLKKITFDIFTDENVDMFEVWALNELRRRLAGAHKITIFIEERQFMAIKWLAKSNWSMIEWKPCR